MSVFYSVNKYLKANVAECNALGQMVANGKCHVAEYMILCHMVATGRLYVA